MVTIIGYSRKTNLRGKDFNVLVLQGGIELVKSKTSDSHYLTAMRCTIPSTFNDETCEFIIGQKLPGKIVKKSCEPFLYVDKVTGEEIEFNYRYAFLPEGSTLEEVIFEGVPETASFK